MGRKVNLYIIQFQEHSRLTIKVGTYLVIVPLMATVVNMSGVQVWYKHVCVSQIQVHGRAMGTGKGRERCADTAVKCIYKYAEGIHVCTQMFVIMFGLIRNHTVITIMLLSFRSNLIKSLPKRLFTNVYMCNNFLNGDLHLRSVPLWW